METIDVREAAAADISAAIDLVVLAAARAFSRYGTDADVRTWQMSVPSRWKALLGRDDALVLVAYAENVLISTAFAEERAAVVYFGGAYSSRPGTGAGSELVR